MVKKSIEYRNCSQIVNNFLSSLKLSLLKFDLRGNIASQTVIKLSKKGRCMALLEFFNRYVFGVLTPAALMSAGVFYAVKLKFFHIIYPRRLLRGMLRRNSNGGNSSLRALSLALAGTLGVGNIVGVASAIALGGFGSIFWMWVSALAAMLLKYSETVLAIIHRRRDLNGNYHGGAMYYIKDRFSSIGRGRWGNLLAAVFALLCILNALTMGCMIQTGAVTSAFEGIFSFEPAFIGGVFSVLAIAVIITGARGISSMTEKLVPLMTLVYFLLSAAVMLREPTATLNAFRAIFFDAFSADSAAGGVLGFLVARGVRYGTMRGLMSNEGGCGTAPIAHASSNVRYAAAQGVWGIFEVFIDTILLCTMTAIVIIINYDTAAEYTNDPMLMTLRAYSASLGEWSEYCMCIMVLFFGFATVICWAHYGMECLSYLTKNPWAKRLFIALYFLSMLWGSVGAPALAWGLADLALGSMTLINLAVICPMHREVVRETDIYIKETKIRP